MSTTASLGRGWREPLSHPSAGRPLSSRARDARQQQGTGDDQHSDNAYTERNSRCDPDAARRKSSLTHSDSLPRGGCVVNVLTQLPRLRRPPLRRHPGRPETGDYGRYPRLAPALAKLSLVAFAAVDNDLHGLLVVDRQPPCPAALVLAGDTAALDALETVRIGRTRDRLPSPSAP